MEGGQHQIQIGEDVVMLLAGALFFLAGAAAMYLLLAGLWKLFWS
jgi:hypothetical protein